MHKESLLICNCSVNQDDMSVIMTVGRWSETSDSDATHSYYGYDQSHGKLSRIPYWGNKSNYLCGLYCYIVHKVWTKKYTYFMIYNKSNIKCNNVITSNKNLTDRATGDVLGLKDKSTIKLTFNPPPTGFL